MTANNKPTVFISYSHRDEEWKDRLKPQLLALEMANQLIVWDDRKIDGGDKWYPEIEQAMEKASVAVCLISENFLSSKFCIQEEIPFLLKRTEDKNMLFIPVLISPCPWTAFRWLKETQMLPRDGKSIVKDFRENWSVAFSEVSDLILKKLSEPDYSLPAVSIKWAPPEKIDIDRLPKTGSILFGREKELKILDEAWETDTRNIISFIAWGGVGKSTLINRWLDYMAEENYKGAERVFAWSFYSQGTNEQVSSADTFLSEALQWFGDPDPKTGSAWDKGQRLAGLIRQKKTILILDGMEPLQSEHEFERGKIKDQGLAALLRSLAMNNNGLCIITSRENVTDILRYRPKVEELNLDKLSTNAGRALLRVGGVKGTDSELEAAVEAFGNHALAIKLIPVYLQSFKDHHVSDALQIPGLDIPLEKGRHPRRVIEALCVRYKDKPENDLLKLLGFFDRPAAIEAIHKIIEVPVIEGLTEQLCNKGEATLLQAINALREEGLLAAASKHNPNTLDCHPLIREHFGEKLEQENPAAWREAHARLYEYYKNLPEKERPDTLEEMEPLFAAVAHGCQAGKHQEALDDVFWNKIYRGNEKYTIHKLGAFGADLSCLSHFFEKLWDRPAKDLTASDKAVVLSWSGFALRAVGRLSEATEPMKAGMEMQAGNEDWKNAASASSNLSELYLTIGEVAEAVNYGKQSVDYANRSGDENRKEAFRTTYADALFQSGEGAKAEQWFKEAEQMQQKRRPEYPYLYSLPGFRYCDLLLSQGKTEEVLERVQETIKIAQRNYWLLDVALDKLTIGKALFLQSLAAIDHPPIWGDRGGSKAPDPPLIRGDRDGSEALTYLSQAVNGLQEAGQQIMLPRGLLARAAFYAYQKDLQKSWQDLDECKEIAEYGQMKLHLADYHLEAGRVIRKQLAGGSGQSAVGSWQSAVGGGSQQLEEFEVIVDGETLQLTRAEMQKKFREHVAAAERLVKEMGYHRRYGELEELRGGLRGEMKK